MRGLRTLGGHWLGDPAREKVKSGTTPGRTSGATLTTAVEAAEPGSAEFPVTLMKADTARASDVAKEQKTTSESFSSTARRVSSARYIVLQRQAIWPCRGM